MVARWISCAQGYKAYLKRFGACNRATQNELANDMVGPPSTEFEFELNLWRACSTAHYPGQVAQERLDSCQKIELVESHSHYLYPWLVIRLSWVSSSLSRDARGGC